MNRTRGIFLALALLALAAGAAWRWVPQIVKNPLGAPNVFEKVVNLLEPASPSVSTPGPLRAPERARGAALARAGVLHWTNLSRSSAGRTLLREQTPLDAAAEAKLADMFARAYFAHENPDGEGIAVAVKEAGYVSLRVGENLALGNFASDEKLVAAWMESPGHRANILDPRFTEIGIAVGPGTFQGQRTWMAVQVFALPRSACPTVDEKLRVVIEEQRATIGRLADEIKRLAAEGNAKIEEGNREIEEGNRIALETGDREAAEPHWENGEQLQAEGRSLHEQARAKAAEAERIQKELNANIARYNSQVEALNRCV